MTRKPYDDDPGPTEFTGDGQFTSEGHGALPGVGVVPPNLVGFLEWYGTNPADASSSPAPNGGSVGDDTISKNR